jgi:hypothetical protein
MNIKTRENSMMPPIPGLSALVPDRHIETVAMPASETLTKNEYQSRPSVTLDEIEQWDTIRQQKATELEEEFNPERVERMSVGDALRFRQRLNEQELTVTFCKSVADSCVQSVKTLSSGS